MTAKSNTQAALSALYELLAKGRFNYSDEKRCQKDMAIHFDRFEIHYEREFVLEGGIVDFYFPRSGLAIEVKASTHTSKAEVYRQCERYCLDNRVTGLLLATGRAQGLPPSIADKPVLVYNLGIGYL